ncbi:unnamed protein product [Lasius platythorax]|uniref:Uncharacterized protein n=1 Tax=Lasius platythorax TaxID=488582 RepID=A0AAV2NB18_9HYME
MLRKRPLKGATPDQDESLVPSRHNGTVTWNPLRKFNAAEIAKARAGQRKTKLPAALLLFFFLPQRVHVMSKSKYPRTPERKRIHDVTGNNLRFVIPS